MKAEEHSPRADTADVQDRGAPPVNRVRSMQAKVSAVLAIGVSTLLGAGFLTWYYGDRLSGDAPASAPAKRKPQSVDNSLPPLDRPRAPSASASVEQEPAGQPFVETVLGPPPPEPLIDLGDSELADGEVVSRSPTDDAPARVGEHSTQSQGRREVERSGPAFISFVDRAVSADPSLSLVEASEGEASRGAQLSRSLKSEVVPTVRAQRLPDLRFLLPKGAPIDCTLETAVDTSLPSLVTCIAASDTYSADGTVVLIERGAKFFGETRPTQTDAGARVFVVWTEVRSGSVVAQIDSPATDAQGRGGLPGYIDRHFWLRFGAAFLISLIDGGMDAAAKSRDRDAAVVINPEQNNVLLTEVLRSTADIRPTRGVLPGSRVNVLIARDVDFSSVYELTHAPR